MNTTVKACLGMELVAVDAQTRAQIVQSGGTCLLRCSRRLLGVQDAVTVLSPSPGKRLRVYLAYLQVSAAATASIHVGNDPEADDAEIATGDFAANGGFALNLAGNYDQLEVDQAVKLTSNCTGTTRAVIYYSQE